MNRTLEELRVIETFLDGVAARGETLATAREEVSCHIFLTELHSMCPDRDREFRVSAAANFLMEARRK